MNWEWSLETEEKSLRDVLRRDAYGGQSIYACIRAINMILTTPGHMIRWGDRGDRKREALLATVYAMVRIRVLSCKVSGAVRKEAESICGQIERIVKRNQLLQ